MAEQFSAATRRFDTPKNHQRREAPLTAHARQALLGLAREGEFCFVSLRGEHWTPSSRAYGHRDKRRALDRIVSAYATRTENRPKRAGSSTAALSQQSLFGDTYV